MYNAYVCVCYRPHNECNHASTFQYIHVCTGRFTDEIMHEVAGQMKQARSEKSKAEEQTDLVLKEQGRKINNHSWAWGTGSAELYQKKTKSGKDTCGMPKGTFHAKPHDSRSIGIHPGREDNDVALRCLFEWPGEPRLDMAALLWHRGVVGHEGPYRRKKLTRTNTGKWPTNKTCAKGWPES